MLTGQVLFFSFSPSLLSHPGHLQPLTEDRHTRDAGIVDQGQKRNRSSEGVTKGSGGTLAEMSTGGALQHVLLLIWAIRRSIDRQVKAPRDSHPRTGSYCCYNTLSLSSGSVGEKSRIWGLSRCPVKTFQ
uniref:Uncharacterized protein n=1 Tax=Physcomitrium patens TaxID=3218 RepID=A0A2K1KBN5_PHYPA|nr:hypothetical protein PHYPA_010367 [Physcomitrium patens]